MRLARITGTATATTKDARLVGQRLLLADLVDAKGASLETGHVLADSCGAGPGDLVLAVQGSAARMPEGMATLPVDFTAIAIIDRVTLG